MDPHYSNLSVWFRILSPVSQNSDLGTLYAELDLGTKESGSWNRLLGSIRTDSFRIWFSVLSGSGFDHPYYIQLSNMVSQMLHFLQPIPTLFSSTLHGEESRVFKSCLMTLSVWTMYLSGLTTNGVLSLILPRIRRQKIPNNSKNKWKSLIKPRKNQSFSVGV